MMEKKDSYVLSTLLSTLKEIAPEVLDKHAQQTLRHIRDRDRGDGWQKLARSVAETLGTKPLSDT